ncbi:hypothetical protein K1719_040177 [Acacia pycnantha]|nr:hypothetical protein K1719_040177 [Acacia pycnantha]
MGSKWRKLKLALGLNLCVHVPRDIDDSSPSQNSTARFIGSYSPSDVSPSGDSSGYRSTTPTTSSSALRLTKSGSKSPKGTCAICLTTMKAGQGHAIFTAECSHSFHFHCITSNVKHGNQVCPVCRAKWKEVPFESPVCNVSHGMPRINQVPRDNSWTTIIRRLPSQQVDSSRQITSLYNVAEPAIFDDDEDLDQQTSITHDENEADHDSLDSMEITTYLEVSAVPKLASHDEFAVLIHLKAPPHSRRKQNNVSNDAKSSPSAQTCRAPIDLVTVLDVSGSMSEPGSIRSAIYHCLLLHSPPYLSLHRMTETGRQQALQAVNSLISSGGTNIADGLRKGAKVFTDRHFKNPVCSIILLSDDTVHAFGFGADHDATSMHSISEMSGGTFSFIEAEDVIQDAFAQCIGGLLSVVVQELQVKVECVHPALKLGSVKAGSYQTSTTADARMATVNVGDLYAEEERDFLVTVSVPIDKSCDEMSLLIVRGLYRDPLTKEMVALEGSSKVKIQRPDVAGELVVSIEVDRQRNRLRAAEAMAEARVAAERGDLTTAVSVLESCHKALAETVSAQAGDRLVVALSAELKEMQGRMADRRVYEQSGRAYVLHGDSFPNHDFGAPQPQPQPQPRRVLRLAKSFPQRQRGQ